MKFRHGGGGYQKRPKNSNVFYGRPLMQFGFFLMAMISLKKCDFLYCSLQQTFGVVSTFCAVVKVIYIPSTTIDLVSFFYWAVLKIYALKSTFLGQNTSSIQSKLYIPSTYNKHWLWLESTILGMYNFDCCMYNSVKTQRVSLWTSVLPSF